MKRCPTCQSTYTDDSLTFCLTDGAALVGGAAFNPQATLPDELQVTLPNQNAATLRDDPAEPSFPQQPAALAQSPAPPAYNAPPAGWNPPAWRPLVSQPIPPPRRRNLTPWVVGGLVSLLLGAAVVVWAIIAARRPADETANTANRGNGNVQVVGNNTNGNNSNGSPRNQNTSRNNNNSATTEEDAPPTDPDVVLTQLTALEYEWNDANIKGNKAAVRRILADEFRGVGGDGSVKNKEQLLATLEPEPLIASLKLSDLKISLAGDTVVLTGLNTARSTRGQVLKFRFTDTFLWRDGRWQAISSQASQVR
ncbi:MAG TPA: nuclear transport factor 2 family protein [Pyrinomonadaceae bacterium]|nr:nuclear transport factor 2 family protein [Pyrinomonadaceae bacterium]